jgi:hypothetical protein
MPRCDRWLTVTVLAALLVAAPAALPAQTSAQHIDAAKQLLEAGHFDSATAVLRGVIDRDPAARIEAYVWLGIVNHFAQRDSVARAAFRAAFALSPGLSVEGIAELDPRLGRILSEERAAALGEPPPAAAATAPDSGESAAPMARCLPQCLGAERGPELVSMPRVSFPDHLEGQARDLQLTVRAVVDTIGRVEAGTVEIIRTNVASMSADIENAVRRARFRPARNQGKPVRALVELSFRARSMGNIMVLGPPIEP